MKLTKKIILNYLAEVKDPEITVLSLIDLGVITNIDISDNDHVKVEMIPTYMGCPGIDYMKADVIKALKEKGIDNCEVNVTTNKQWNSNLITEKGRQAIKAFGLAPPQKHNMNVEVDIIENVACPFCDSKNTELKNPFGPTLCRSMHYCNDCKQMFEQFKPI